MSASNWAVCPRCLATARAAHEGEVASVMATYGKVPVDEFNAARSAIKDVNPEDFQTFREDHEFSGVENGIVQLSYGGRCSECGIGIEFSDERHFYWEDAEEQARLAVLRAPALHDTSEDDEGLLIFPTWPEDNRRGWLACQWRTC